MNIEPVQAAFQLRIQGALCSQTVPKDLYIPPNALEIFLEAFEGPLDLLLYLIRKHDLDILDIPIAQVTAQYLSYIDMMQIFQWDLAAEYLLMAATLAEIKSRMLLPQLPHIEGEEADPRAELIRRLQLYEQFKRAAEELDELPRVDRDIFPAVALMAPHAELKQHPPVAFKELLFALQEVLRRAEHMGSHSIEFETLTVRQAMTYILEQIDAGQFTAFEVLFQPNTGRRGVIVTFLALLELLKEAMLELVQAHAFAPIYVRAISC